MVIPEGYRRVLMGDYTSRQNKLWLVTGWKRFCNFYIEWKWEGEAWRSRMMFQFCKGGEWEKARSFEEDRLVLYKGMMK